MVQQLDEDGDENENVNICSSEEDDATKMDWSSLQVRALQSSISLRQYTSGWTPSLRDDHEEILTRYAYIYFSSLLLFIHSLAI